MTILHDFEPKGEVTAADRARIALGRAGVSDGDKFAVAVNDEGQILLTPLTTIPRRELIVWEDEQLKASLMRGLADAANGRTSPLNLDDLDLDEEEE